VSGDRIVQCPGCGIARSHRNDRDRFCSPCRDQAGRVLPGEWVADARCRTAGFNPEWWFPSADDSVTRRRAVAVCRSCPVAAECLNYANRVGEVSGIWGGRTPEQRRRDLVVVA
jgi:WhiB family redox-sensing transcriptional regulator